MVNRLRILWTFFCWLERQPKGASMLFSQTEDETTFFVTNMEQQSIPAFFVIDDPERPINEPFQRRCADGKYGWYIRNAYNGYAFLMPVLTGDFESDKRITGGLAPWQDKDEMEPNVSIPSIEHQLAEAKQKLWHYENERVASDKTQAHIQAVESVAITDCQSKLTRIELERDEQIKAITRHCNREQIKAIFNDLKSRQPDTNQLVLPLNVCGCKTAAVAIGCPNCIVCGKPLSKEG